MAKVLSPTNPHISILGFLFWKFIELIGFCMIVWGITLIVTIMWMFMKGQHVVIPILSNCYIKQHNITMVLIRSVSCYDSLYNQLSSRLHMLEIVGDKLITKSNKIIEMVPPSCAPIVTRLRGGMLIISNYIEAMWLITQIGFDRLIIIITYLPLFLVLSLVAMIDGVTQRKLRQLNGATERASIYQYAKKGVSVSFMWGAALYLILPLTLAPEMILVPCYTVANILLAVTIKHFKKYL